MKSKTSGGILTGRARLALIARAIDCGLLFGHDGSNQHEFATAQEAVKARARLGIRRGFIGSLTAESLSPWEAACEVDAFCRSKAVRNAFFPAFTIHGNEFFGEGREEAFAAIVKKNPYCLFRLCVNGRDELFRSSLRFVAAATKGRPAVAAVRVSDIPSLAALVDLARQYPEIRLLVTENSWGTYSFVQEAMREAPNILADTSVIHSEDQIELLVARHGADRVIFSLGYRALGGAALGSVLAADISPADKEAILSGNISRLLGLPEIREPAVPAVITGEWKSFLETGAPSFPIIDCHGHFGPNAVWPLREQSDEKQILRKRADMGRQNLRYFVFSGTRALFGDPVEGNAIVERLVAAAADPRFLAYFVYNPRYGAKLERFLTKVPRSRTFVGFKVLCDYWKVRIDDPGFVPMWTVADRFQLPVLIHTWESSWNFPSMLEPVAAAYPGAKLILAHSGGGNDGRCAAEAVVREHRNAYLEWCGSFHSRKPWEQTIREVGVHKLLFGTDATLHSHDWELARLLSLPLETDDFRRILHDNFMGIIAPLLENRDLSLICQDQPQLGRRQRPQRHRP